VVKFNADGTLAFESFIEKQFSYPSTNAYNHIYFTEYGGNYYFLFNNRKNTAGDKGADTKGMVITDLVKIDSSGNIVSRKSIFANKNTDMLFSPGSSQDMKNGKLLIYGRRGTNYRFGTINLE
jgi:hypothetical protein